MLITLLSLHDLCIIARFIGTVEYNGSTVLSLYSDSTLTVSRTLLRPVLEAAAVYCDADQ